MHFTVRPWMESKQSVREALAEIQPSKSLIPFYSTVTGILLDGRELDAEYWWNNIRKPVLFEQATKNIIDDGINIFIEVGPHPVLRSYIKSCLKDKESEGRIITHRRNGNNSPESRLEGVQPGDISGSSASIGNSFFRSLADLFNCQTIRGNASTIGTRLHRSPSAYLIGTKSIPCWDILSNSMTSPGKTSSTPQLYPTLADHIVGDATVFPGTGFAELALAAALTWHPGELADIEGLEITPPCS